MIHVPGGRFRMGSDEYKETLDWAGPVHEVTVGDFYIGKYPVTQEFWIAVMGKQNHHSMFYGKQKPVEHVTWNEAKVFVYILELITGKPYRLPTEAEWEYAARGGLQSRGYRYAGSDNLDEVGWYRGSRVVGTAMVGQKKPNELGLYDMSGNAWEWVEDCFNSYDVRTPRDGSARISRGYEEMRVMRGGGWNQRDICCRVAHRFFSDPAERIFDTGLRLALPGRFGSLHS